MKKFLLVCICACLAYGTAVAEVIKLKATEFAIKTKNDNGKWTKWTDWEETSCLIVINGDKDRINIYSAVTQEYDIIEDDGEEESDDGSVSHTFKCIDADGDRCDVRFRVQKDGQLQLYVDYADAMWVYNVELK